MSNNIRIEEDLLGTREVPARLTTVFIPCVRLKTSISVTVKSVMFGICPRHGDGKKAAAMANKELHTIPRKIADIIIQACDEVLDKGKCMDQFPVDVFQGGAGTSLNMNTNEVLANIGLELMGHQKEGINTLTLTTI